MKKLSLQEWRARSRSAIALFPTVYTMEYLATDLAKKEYGARVNSIITAMMEKEFVIVIDSKLDFKKIGKILTKKFKGNPGYLDKLIAWSESQKNVLVDFLSKNLNTDSISKLTNSQIARRYAEYVNKYIYYHLKNTPPWWIGALIAERELKEFLEAAKVKDVENCIAEITEPFEYQTANFQEEISLLDIAGKIQGKNKRIRSAIDLPHNVSKEFKHHVEMFSSAPFGYNTGIVWDDSHFIEELDKFLVIGNPQEKKRSKHDSIRKKIKKRDLTLSRLNLPKDMLNLAFALRKLSYLQELKKITQVRSHPILQLVVKKEIAKRIKVEKELLDYLSKDEMISSLKKGKINPKLLAEAKERRKYCVQIAKDGKYEWLYGDEAKEFVKVNKLVHEIDDLTEIRGSIACNGNVKGIAKVCHSSTEINKVLKGDVLITAMTTPDFVPAIKRASAIITDEGGITCHAAIVSRELKKPCIIGTKIATKVLKDGDLIEVDANNGIVKIIKKAK